MFFIIPTGQGLPRVDDCLQRLFTFRCMPSPSMLVGSPPALYLINPISTKAYAYGPRIIFPQTMPPWKFSIYIYIYSEEAFKKKIKIKKRGGNAFQELLKLKWLVVLIPIIFRVEAKTLKKHVGICQTRGLSPKVGCLNGVGRTKGVTKV